MPSRQGRWRLPVGLRFTLVLSLIPLIVLPLIGLAFRMPQHAPPQPT